VSFAVRGVLVGLVVGVAGLGIVLMLSQLTSNADRVAYNGLPRCPAGAPLTSTECWPWQPGTIISAGRSFTSLGARRDLVAFRTAQLAGVAEVEPTAAFTCASPGDPVVAKFWNGRLTGLYTSHGLIVTPSNPNVASNDRLEAGVLLLSAALIVPVGALVARRRHRDAARHSVRGFFEDPLVLGAFILFGIGQLADVVTSALGQRNGLLESNALVADVIRVAGPMGFLLVRLPVLVLAVIGIMRLPRLVAVGVLVGCGVYFTAVGGHNLQLALAAVNPSSCPSVPLP
jgi:hypothetical protein